MDNCTNEHGRGAKSDEHECAILLPKCALMMFGMFFGVSVSLLRIGRAKN